MKKTLVLSCLLALAASAQEKTTKAGWQKPALQRSDGYRPSDVKVFGDLRYGQSSRPVLCTTRPRYAAFVFDGYGGDVVEVTVRGEERSAFVVLTDSTLIPIAGGRDRLVVSLPYRGPDIEVFYIVFRQPEAKPSRFTVLVRKLNSSPEKTSAVVSPDGF